MASGQCEQGDLDEFGKDFARANARLVALALDDPDKGVLAKKSQVHPSVGTLGHQLHEIVEAGARLLGLEQGMGHELEVAWIQKPERYVR
ncbi:hypothetical protein D3C85_1450050 [compost metagenome]